MHRINQRFRVISGLFFITCLSGFMIIIPESAKAQTEIQHCYSLYPQNESIGLSAYMSNLTGYYSLFDLQNFQSDDEWDENWDDVWDESGGKRISFHVRYNRVEGSYSGIRVEKDYWIQRYPNRPFLYGLAGYGLKAKKFEYQIGLEMGFFNDYRFAFGGEYHQVIDTPDRWIISDTENSLAAFFLQEDFHDFFMKEGGSGYITQNLTRTFVFSAGYHAEQFDSLKKNTEWSLFGGKKRFPENPSMDSGELRSFMGGFVMDSRNSISQTTGGWYIQAEYEHAGEDIKSDFHFDRLMVDIRRYQSLGYFNGLDLRLRIGSSKGNLPWQKSFHLGGLSTLRGFPYKVFPEGRMHSGGNRMILAQAEYRMGSQDLPDEMGLWILEELNIILFVDAGWVGYADEDSPVYRGFKHLLWSSFKSDVGIALTNQEGNLRFEIARRTDTSHKPFVFLFRISRSF